MKDKDLLKLLLNNGWPLVRINGSHHIVEKSGQIETIPIHGKDVPIGLLNKILKRTGLKKYDPLAHEGGKDNEITVPSYFS